MYQILLAGVGGQGTVLASKILACAAMQRGEGAHTAETIGMAQRGGSVVSHVRLGDDVFSPLIPKGTADVIIGFEPAEAVRALTYLKPNGAVLTNSMPVRPASDAFAKTPYDPQGVLETLKAQPITLQVIDGAKLLAQISPKSLNIALLGAAASAGFLPFTLDELGEAVKQMVKPKFHEMNLRALRASLA